MIQQTRLSSGALLVTDARPQSASFNLSIWFPQGSMHEAPRARGFVHFIEHMVFKGSHRRSGPEIWKLFERTGGYINAFTERDCMCVHATVPARHWIDAAEGLVDAVFGSAFPDSEFEKEKNVIISEIQQYEDSYDDLAWDGFLARFRKGSGIGGTILGSARQIARVERDSLYEAYELFCQPRKALIIATGELPSSGLEVYLDAAIHAALSTRRGTESETIRVAKKRGKAIAFFANAPSPAPASRFFSRSTASCEQVYVTEGFQLGSPLSFKDRACLAAFSGVLGEASNSRLFMEIRERLGIAYSVSSALSQFKDEAILSIHGVVDVKNLRAYLGATSKVIQGILKNGIEESELEEARERMAGSLILSLEDPESRAKRIAGWIFLAGRVPDESEEADLYRSLRIEDFRIMLERLSASPRACFCLGPSRARSALREKGI